MDIFEYYKILYTIKEQYQTKFSSGQTVHAFTVAWDVAFNRISLFDLEMDDDNKEPSEEQKKVMRNDILKLTKISTQRRI